MTILFCSDSDPPEPWRLAIARAFPHMPFRIWPDCGPAGAVNYALVWRPPPGMLARLPNLKAILVLGAGVDSALDDPELPAGVPVLRLVDAGLPEPMAEYALHAVLHFQRRMPGYLAQQRQAVWQRIPWLSAAQWPVGGDGPGRDRQYRRAPYRGLGLSGRRLGQESAIRARRGDFRGT